MRAHNAKKQGLGEATFRSRRKKLLDDLPRDRQSGLTFCLPKPSLVGGAFPGIYLEDSKSSFSMLGSLNMLRIKHSSFAWGQLEAYGLFL